MPADRAEHDEFVKTQKSSNNKKTSKTIRIIAEVLAAGIGAYLIYLVAKKPANKKFEFKTVEQAKEFFEKIGIKTEFHDVNETHLPLLNRIKENLKQLKKMGVKINKPDSIVISDWKKAGEYEDLCRKFRISTERKENYQAFCAGAKDKKCHIFVNSNHPEFDKFMHEMGHANHQVGLDSYMHSKGFIGHDFADKQLELLGTKDKVYRDGYVQGSNLNNILSLHENNLPAQYVFPNAEGEARFVNAKGMIDKMYSETKCYDGGKLLMEEIADIFEGLSKGKTFSDETMLYYDFAGGARIPNLKIDGKTYDEYIESLYNNKDLIQKLRENIKVSKL